MIVSSANSVDGYYEVDMNSWKATKVPNGGSVFNASDLANGNLAFESKKTTTIPAFITRSMVRSNKITIYPNPVVTRGLFRVSFNTGIMGRYDVQLVDLTGRVISQKAVSGNNQGQATRSPPAQLSKGMYLVKVVSGAQKTVFADKLVIAD